MTHGIFLRLISNCYRLLDNKIEEHDFANPQRTLMAFNMSYDKITTGVFLELIKMAAAIIFFNLYFIRH